jgi:geranylgeranyl pyrophosphate synthase
LVVEAAGSDPRAGLPLAAAAECLIAASDVLDDVEDGDSATGLERVCGLPTAINVAVFLAFLGQLAIYRLTDLGAHAQVVRDVGRVLATAAARACGGQQRDIDQDDELLTERGYLDMVQAKSGALVEGLCRAAAIVACAQPKATECYAQFGRNLGMALQISNDMRAVSAQPDHRNDLVIGKRTLPLVFALQQGPPMVHRLACNARAGQLRPRQAQRLGELLRASGGVLYASVIADVFFEEACAWLDEADCSQTSRLRAYMTAIRDD